MNPIRWITPLTPVFIAALAGLTVPAVAVRAQSAPGVDAATLAKYDKNHNGVLDPDEQAAMNADNATATTSSSGTSSGSGEIIQLSPFQVDATKDRGYFAENTLAGSRMNTNLSDLGAAISVVTKAQLEDTASVDINDVFRYEINTEGSSTYTPQIAAFRNDGLVDVNAGGTQGNAVSSFTNANANRVRGLGVPSSSLNYFPVISAVPPDAYNVQSFEISRGPNSMLFGMGSPAGVVNTTTQQAILNRDTNRVEMRIDNWGSQRASLSFNRALIRDKAAIYVAALYDDRQFSRKPSFDTTRRLYGAVTIKPFSRTTIRANVESYDNKNHRPNTISPIDYATQWNLAGRPAYDALTKKVTFLANTDPAYASFAGSHKAGDVVGPFIANSASPLAQGVRDYLVGLSNFNPALRGGAPSGQTLSNSNFTTYGGNTIFGQNALNTLVMSNGVNINPLYIPGLGEINQSRTVMQIGNGQLQNWFQPMYNTNYTNAWGTATNPAANPANFPAISSSGVYSNATWAEITNRDTYQSTGFTNQPALTNVGSYRYPGVTDRAIYDWKKVNILQADFGSQRNANYEVDLEQEITKDLYFNAGWLRQDFDQFSNYTIGQLNATSLRIDVNKYLPDGTPNPYFGKPYVFDFDPDRYVNAETDDHFRGMLAYTPDFTRNKNWTRWLGHHQFLALWSRDEYMSVAYRQRLNYVAAGNQDAAFRFLPNPNNDASGNPTGWNFQGKGSLQRFYYLASPSDPSGVVTKAPGEWNALSFSGNIRDYDYANNRWQDSPVSTMFNNFDSPSRNQRTLQSYSGGMTNYLWNERLVTTFGARVDKFKARTNSTGAITMPDGTVIPTLTSPMKWQNGYLNTDVSWNRFSPWQYLTGRTKTGGGVLRPFRNWESIDSRASGNWFWQFVRDFGITYNWSNNFDAPSQAQVDAFGTPLPKPQGVGRDYGIQFSMMDNRLFAKISWFQATNMDQRISPGATIGRLTGNIDSTLFRNWARTITLINMGQDPRDTTTFGANLTQQQEDAVQAGAEKIWQLPYNYYGSVGNIGATADTEAKGWEASLNYNTGNWRNRLTASKQVSVNSNVLKQFDSWYNKRNPVWQAAKAADYLLPQYQSFATYTTTGGTPVDITNFWTSYGFRSEVRLNDAFGNTNVANYYQINVTPQIALSKDLEGQAAPNQRKYHLAYNTGYDFTTGRLAGISVGGAERWEDKSVIGYFGKTSHTNSAIPNLLDTSDTSRPIYDKANAYTDLYVRYKRKVWSNRVTMTLQVNVVNAFETGHLQVTAVNYDGTPWGYRIIDPRQFIFTAGFDF